MIVWRYEDEDQENAVEVCDGIYSTFTRGTLDHLYRGESAAAAAESLEMTAEEFANLLASDPVELEDD